MVDALSYLMFMFAFVCFILAAWRSSSPDWNRLVAVGFVFLTLALHWAHHSARLGF